MRKEAKKGPSLEKYSCILSTPRLAGLVSGQPAWGPRRGRDARTLPSRQAEDFHDERQQGPVRSCVEPGELLQFCVLGLGLLHDRDVGVGVPPESEEILIRGTAAI